MEIIRRFRTIKPLWYLWLYIAVIPLFAIVYTLVTPNDFAHANLLIERSHMAELRSNLASITEEYREVLFEVIEERNLYYLSGVSRVEYSDATFYFTLTFMRREKLCEEQSKQNQGLFFPSAYSPGCKLDYSCRSATNANALATSYNFRLGGSSYLDSQYAVEDLRTLSFNTSCDTVKFGEDDLDIFKLPVDEHFAEVLAAAKHSQHTESMKNAYHSVGEEYVPEERAEAGIFIEAYPSAFEYISDNALETYWTSQEAQRFHRDLERIGSSVSKESFFRNVTGDFLRGHSKLGNLMNNHIYLETGRHFEPSWELYFRMVYFSAVTITTLGYGDIAPISATSRLLVTLESVLGIVLIGLFLNSLAPKVSVPKRQYKCCQGKQDRQIHRDE